jgi:hypothetical protein
MHQTLLILHVFVACLAIVWKIHRVTFHASLRWAFVAIVLHISSLCRFPHT